MTNKKLWLSLLAVVLIVCMLSVGLMSCKKKTEEPEDPGDDDVVTLEEQAAEAIIEGIQKSLAAADMTDLRLDGEIELTVGEKVYTVALALDLDLRQFNGYEYTQCKASSTFDASEQYFKVKEDDEEEYEEAKGLTEEEFNKSKTTYYTRHKKDLENDNFSNTALTAEIREGKKVLLGVYYSDSQEDIGTKDPFTGDKLYVQYLPEGATTTTKMQFNAPYVAATMLALGGSVDFHGIDLAELDIWDTLGGVLPIIGSLADKTQTEFVANQKASLTINLGAVLNQFSDVLSSASGYVDPLGLELNLSDLGTILPAISIKLAADLDSTGMATNVGLSLTIPEKDVEIKNKDTKKTFLNINMTKDVEIGLGLRYTLYDTDEEPNYFFPSSYDAYEEFDNIIDADLSVDLYLGNAITYDIELNSNKLHIAVDPGYYRLSLDAALNPFVLLQYLKDDATKKIDFSSTPKIIDSIQIILEAVNALELKLTKYTAADYKTEDSVAVQLVVGKEYVPDTKDFAAGKFVKVSTTILSNTGSGKISLDKGSIDDAIGLVKGFIEKSGKAEAVSTEEEKEDTITPILTEVGKYLAGAVIRINNDDYAKVYAHFDSNDTVYKVIPFGGYTEWTGEIKGTEDFKFYTKTADAQYNKVSSTATYDEKATYYTFRAKGYYEYDKTKGWDDMRYLYSKSGDTYSEIANKAAFDAAEKVYVWEGDAYNEVSVDKDSFKPAETTYYTRTAETYSSTGITAAQAKVAIDAAKEASTTVPTYYVKGLSDGGDFGLGLAATLEIDDNIKIDATITNLNIFGFPAAIHATISNLQLNLWDNNYPVFVGSNVTDYETAKKAS